MKLARVVLVVLVFTLGLVACKGETKPATNVTSTSARLNLTGEADSGAAYSYFEYWQTATPSLKYTTPTRNWPAGAKGDFPETVTGLRQGTSYSFRACGNDVGKTASCMNTLSFTTGVSGVSGLAYDAFPAAFGRRIFINTGQLTFNTPNVGFHIDPTWSPDGTRIAFVAAFDGLWTVNAAGGTPVRLRADSNMSANTRPAWSHDGTRIAITGGFVRVSDGAFSSGTHGSDPSWSPGDKKIASTSSGGEIFTRTPGGSGTNVTNNPSDDRHPAWSPDGTKIAFSSDRAGDGFDIWVMNADGTNPTRLTTLTTDELSPTWSADGTRIAFHNFEGGELRSISATAAGTGTTIATTPDAPGEQFPDYSPRP